MTPPSSLRANLLANLVGQVWVALIGIVFVPLYIHHIGVESYGVVGFFVAVQALYSLFDMGLTATLNREMALLAATQPGRIGTLVRTLEWMYLPFALAIGGVTWLMADIIATHWVRPVHLTHGEVAQGIALLGLAAALQWPASFHIAGLAGLQRQVLLNAMKIGSATITSVGCLVVVMHVPTLAAFLWWQVAMAALQSMVYALVMWRVIPPAATRPAFAASEVRRTYRFAGGMLAVTFVSLALTQADRLVLSGTLTLAEFGNYCVAAALAAMLYRLTQPMFVAVVPRYTQLVAAGDEVELARQYHLTSQALAALLAPAAVMGCVFAEELVGAWSGDAGLTHAVVPVFQLLVVSSAIHGLMTLSYALQIAHGWTRLALYLNMGSVAVVVPLFWIWGSAYGGVGAAWAWVCLTCIYLFVGIPLTHRRLLKSEMWRWYLYDIAPVTIACLTTGLMLRQVAGVLPTNWRVWPILIAFGAITALVGVCALPSLRRAVLGRIAETIQHAVVR